MKNTATIATVCALLLALSGCNTEREPSQERAVLKAGQQVSADMVGWVAVPNTAPQTQQDKNANLTYALVATHNIVPASMDTWVAMNPEFFAQLTDIKLTAKATPASERWVLKPEGKSVPKDKQGWVAVPFSQPRIESSAKHKGREMATLAANQIIPKEMDGWVAVDATTLGKLVEKYMMSGKGSK